MRVDTPVTFKYVPAKADDDTIILSNETATELPMVSEYVASNQGVADNSNNYDEKLHQKKIA